MLMVLSPAKTLDFESPIVPVTPTRPAFAADSRRLVERLRELAPHELATLMDLSDPLAALNAARYAAFRAAPRAAHVRPAVLAFDGDVYDGLAARTMDEESLAFAQRHLRILSGLYGVLRPLDAMQPYRLEMGTRLATAQGRDLYEYWGDRPARALRRALRDAGGEVLVNLASEEYFRAVERKALGVPVIQPVFQERRAGVWRVISFSAKRARGMMARHAIRRRAVRAEELQAFREDGYRFDEPASDAATWYFRREMP
jgi:cytoplasmic iron level regulating protein YaaA (DUF328/UPF0246 family)